MVTYKTLEDYLEKSQKALQEVQEADEEARKARDHYRDQMIAIQSQIELTQQLMDVESNPPHVELPFAQDAIQVLFDNRLEGPDGLTPEEVLKDRQEGVYLREALETVEQIDAINSEKLSAGENSEGDS
jgi:hypothetical protein